MTTDRHMQEAMCLMQSVKFNAHWLGRQEAIAEALEAAEKRERAACIGAVRLAGNFGDYQRHELTADYGQPRFDMMNEIVATIGSRDAS